VYFPSALAATLISPVVLLTKTSPAGIEEKLPPAGLKIVGETLLPEVHIVPEGYLN
jgi:hypothetical protein